MERRTFLAHTLAAPAGLALGSPAWADADAPDAWQQAFDASRAAKPWTAGYVGLQADAPAMPLQMHGRIPAALAGSALLRNGPARHQLGGVRYHHWFDGDGMVQRYRIGTDGVVHEGRFVRTPKFQADSAAGRWVTEAFGTRPPGARPIDAPDDMNVANTSLVQHAGELLALWEGGSATRLDGASLGTLGFKTWSSDYAGAPFSAHPKVEPDGTLWNFGVSSGAGRISLYRIGADGRVLQTATLPVDNPAMVHDFAVTARHLVFLLPPFIFDSERAENGATFLDSHVWRPGLGMRVLVLPKDQLDAPRWFELPAGFVFHLGNAWEEARSGVIHLDYMRSPDDFVVNQTLREVMRGHYAAPPAPNAIALVTIDPARGRASQRLLAHDAEFPRIDPRVVGRRHRQLFVAERTRERPFPGYDSVTRLDLDGERVDRWRYGAHVLVEEHIFVPREGGASAAREGHGWVLGTALDLKRHGMLFSVFDARRLADGPVAQGFLPRVMPLGLHAIHVRA